MSQKNQEWVAESILQLARLGMAGKSADVQKYVRRVVRRARELDAPLAKKLSELVAASGGATLRDAAASSLPVDTDTRLSLAKYEYPVNIEKEPILTKKIANVIDQVLRERSVSKKLLEEGLLPTRSVIFTGPPGVGKTFSARFIANALKMPLVTLDLSAVMSSFLGKTGNNLRNILDYAKTHQCVLLLDEFDAIAKRRDDETEIGELKRLVTVLLQEIDEWPGDSLLIAATNHGELLDPAIWRRFDVAVEFSMPSPEMLRAAIEEDFASDWQGVKAIGSILEKIWSSSSFSDVERDIARIRRKAIVDGVAVSAIAAEMLSEEIRRQPLKERKKIAVALFETGLSDHSNYKITGVSRDVLRKMRKAGLSHGG